MYISTRVFTLAVVLTLLSLGACKKEDKGVTEVKVVEMPAAAEDKLPNADFTTDKAEYSSGETIQLTSTSTDAGSYRWTLPDGHTEKSANISYAIPPSPVDQLLPVKLEAISKNGTKSDYIVKNIKAKKAEGKITLYFQNFSTQFGASISIDGKNVGYSSFTATPIAPTCGANGFPTYTLPVGDHVVTVVDNWTYTKTVTVSYNSCQTLRMD
jgi:PKD repeat protein